MKELHERQTSPPDRKQVALFATCLADLFRPSVAFACIELLERAHCDVIVPDQQTCCGQPAYNSGDPEAAIPLAKNVIAMLAGYAYVVVPSGSCTGMLCEHYPRLLQGDWRKSAQELSARTFELTVFLTDIARLPPRDNAPALPAVTYHDGCAGLREMNIKKQPRQLLKEQCNVEINELPQTEVCCGFGGTFCAKMPEISGKLVNDKLDHALTTGARILAGGDLGCLLHIAGRALRRGDDIDVRHIAELLCDRLDAAAIGKGQ
ncbi:MAG: (Fe-S)-binding protein [Halioglobus sp.]|nr:(Fe-S)-binding protein [Halioglobus sp.]